MHNYISVNDIIFRLKTLFQVNIETKRNNIIEMIGWAVNETGYAIGYVNDVEIIDIENHRSSQLPHQVTNVMNLIRSAKLVKNKNAPYALSHKDTQFYALQRELIALLRAKEWCDEIVPPECMSYDDCGEPIGSYNNIMKMGESLDLIAKASYSYMNGMESLKPDTKNWWYLEGNVIKTSFEKAEGVVVHYKTALLDDDGIPMIYNSPNYINYILYYVMYSLILGAYKHPTITLEFAMHMKDKYQRKALNDKLISNFNPAEFTKQWTSVLKTFK